MPLHQAAGQQDPWASLLGSAVEGEGITVVCGGGGVWVAFVRVRMCGVLDAWVGVGGAMLMVRLCSGGPPQVQHVGRQELLDVHAPPLAGMASRLPHGRWLTSPLSRPPRLQGNSSPSAGSL